MAHQLGRENFTIGTRPRGDGSPYIEVESAYNYVTEERGVETERRATIDLDELLYWIMSDLTFWMAWDYELKNRREGESSRRQAFAKDIELLEMLSPAWAERRHTEYSEILRQHPFNDGLPNVL